MPAAVGAGAGGIVDRRRGAAAPRAEVLRRELGRLGERDVAGEHDGRGARLPVRAVERREVVARDRRRPSTAAPAPDGRRDGPARRPASARTRAATALRVLRLLRRASRWRFFSRSNSDAGNVGLRTTSATIASAGDRLRFSTSKPSRALSRAGAARERRAEIAERVLDLERLARLRAHVDRACTARCARPALPAGSATAPARVTSVTPTFGRSRRSTTKSSRPLSSFAVCTSGAWNGRSAPERRLLRAVERRPSAGAPDFSGWKRTSSAVAACRATSRPPAARRPSSARGSAPCPRRTCRGRRGRCCTG